MTEAGAAAVEVVLCGPLRVTRSGAVIDAGTLGGRKARTVLRLLAARRPDTVSGAQIAAVLWPTKAPADPDAVLASLVSRLRAALGPGAVLGSRGGYRLGVVRVDVDAAAELLREAERRGADEPTLAAAAARGALHILGDGAVLPEEPPDDWAEAVRARVAAMRRRARHIVAESALATGDQVVAGDAARDALADDPLDETAARLLMSALLARQEPAAALTVYATLRQHLADELGVEPSGESQAIHLAALRGTTPQRASPSRRATRPATPGADRLPLTGREDELALLHNAWADVVGGTGRTVLLVGEPGAGKTRLADEAAELARRTGGLVLAARCYEAEQSLFAQPVVDALLGAATRLPLDRVTRAASGHEAALTRLVPELDGLLGQAGRPGQGADTDASTRVRALTAFVRGLAADTPLLLLLDDVQHAGRSTLELLHHLSRRLAGDPVLIVAAFREDEGVDVLAMLGARSSTLALGALSAQAVRTLAGGTGQEHRSAEIVRSTGGNALFVVETLRALGKGELHVPDTLQQAVLERVRRAGEPASQVLRAGAVLGAAFDPATVAALLDRSDVSVLQACEDALAARLLTTAGPLFEFAHDTVREVLLATMASPTRHAYHRRAADLLIDRPEAVAVHAEAIGDTARAARCWLQAAETALTRFAAADAVTLATRAAVMARGIDEPELVGRALLARGRALDARTEYARALRDFEQARAAARAVGDRRLEMAVLRELAGDVPAALGRPLAASEAPLRDALTIAEAIGDRGAAADVLGRLAVLACTRLDLAAGRDLAARSFAAAVAADDPWALARGLDARKAVLSFLGDVAALGPVVEELEPLLRRAGDLWLLQWTLFESAWIPLAAERYDEAHERMAAALDVCRRSGYTAQESYFLAYQGWAHRLAGDLDTAVTVGREAHALVAAHRHMWWSSTAVALLGTSLLDAGRDAEALAVLEPAGLAARAMAPEAYLLRCLSPLARAGGSPAVLDAADRLLTTITAPAWLTGADVYLDLARAWLAAGNVERAREIVGPFRTAAQAAGWPALVRAADAVLG